MKKNLFLSALAIISLATFNSFSQELCVKTSDAEKELAKRIQTEGGEAILAAGDSGDQTLIPYLRCLSKHSNTPWAQISLAKLGDEAAIGEILAEVDTDIANSFDYTRRHFGLEKLTRLGGKTAFQKFYEILLSIEELPQEPRSPKESY